MTNREDDVGLSGRATRSDEGSTVAARQWIPEYTRKAGWTVRGVKDRHGYTTEGDARLIAAAPDLSAALREMIEASAAMMRVINNAVESKADIIDDLEDEFKASGIKDGFGVRARAALSRATES